MSRSSRPVGTQPNAVMTEARNVFRRWLAIFVLKASVAVSNSRRRMIAAARASHGIANHATFSRQEEWIGI
jgi:hypothetical protein